MPTNAEKLQRAFQDWNHTRGGTSAAWLDLMADNVHFQSLAGGGPGAEFTVECHSRADVARYFAELAKGWEMIHYTTKVFAAAEDRVVMLGSTAWRNRRTQRLVDTPKADLVTFRNGQIVEFFEFYDTAKLFAAATT
jgi:hypothetical protein